MCRLDFEVLDYRYQAQLCEFYQSFGHIVAYFRRYVYILFIEI